jgi:uncharacterized protein YneR
VNYKLKNVDGKVEFLLRTGKDFVRNTMSVSSAQYIMENGNITKSTKIGYPINVDDTWYFKGEVVPKTPRKNKEVTE